MLEHFLGGQCLGQCWQCFGTSSAEAFWIVGVHFCRSKNVGVNYRGKLLKGRRCIVGHRISYGGSKIGVQHFTNLVKSKCESTDEKRSENKARRTKTAAGTIRKQRKRFETTKNDPKIENHAKTTT